MLISDEHGNHESNAHEEKDGQHWHIDVARALVRSAPAPLFVRKALTAHVSEKGREKVEGDGRK